MQSYEQKGKVNINKNLSSPSNALFKIDYQGRWYYKDSQIKKESLIKLFGNILRYDKGEYYLVTPLERQKIEVDDVPFIINSMEILKQEKLQKINFITNLDVVVKCGKDNPVIMKADSNGQNIPYLNMGFGLSARISRTVFYELASLSFFGPNGDMGFISRCIFFSLEVTNNE